MSIQSSRRNFLKSIALGGVSAPVAMSSMSTLALAQGNSPKLKVIFAMVPDGFAVDPYLDYTNGLWFPDTEATDTTDFTLNESPRYLEQYANQALFLKGIILGTGRKGHQAYRYALRDRAMSETSVDLLMGAQLQGSDPSLTRIYSGPHAETKGVSYQDQTMLLPEMNPFNLFNRVYQSYSSDVTPIGGNDNTHLFDPVNADLQEMRGLLSGSERGKLDTHLDSIEQVVTDLRNTSPVVEACDPSLAQPTTEALFDLDSSTHANTDLSNYILSSAHREAVTRSHMKVVASGMSCGMTRVSTLMIGRSSDRISIPYVGKTNPHNCSHRDGSVETWKRARAWYMMKVKELCDELASYPDPDVPGDTLLDHTLVVLTGEMSEGAGEHTVNMPVTLLGGASGLLKNGNGQGRFYNIQQYGERTHEKMAQCVDMQRVWSTVAAAAGVSLPYSGNMDTIPGIFTNV